MDRRAMEQSLEQHMPALRVIAGALASSVVVYAATAFLVTRLVLTEPILALARTVAISIAVASLLLILIGYLLGRTIRGAAGAGEPAPGALMQRYTRSVVVSTAAREAAAIIGLVLSLLTDDPLWALLLAGAALLSMLVHWPRRAAVEDWLLQQRRFR